MTTLHAALLKAGLKPSPKYSQSKKNCLQLLADKNIKFTTEIDFGYVSFIVGNLISESVRIPGLGIARTYREVLPLGYLNVNIHSEGLFLNRIKPGTKIVVRAKVTLKTITERGQDHCYYSLDLALLPGNYPFKDLLVISKDKKPDYADGLDNPYQGGSIYVEPKS